MTGIDDISTYLVNISVFMINLRVRPDNNNTLYHPSRTLAQVSTLACSSKLKYAFLNLSHFVIPQLY